MYGRADKSVADINQKIFKEWLPSSINYEIVDGYNIEMYSDPSLYKKGQKMKNIIVRFGF